MSEKRIPIYKIGDKVKLIVEGPDMVVHAIVKNIHSKEFEGLYQCQWFAGKKLETGKFSEEGLMKIPAEEGSEPKK